MARAQHAEADLRERAVIDQAVVVVDLRHGIRVVERLTRRGDGTGSDGLDAVLIVGVRDPARAHELDDDPPTSA